MSSVSDHVLGSLIEMLHRAAAALIVLSCGMFVSTSTNSQEEIRQDGGTYASADPGREIGSAIAAARRELETASAILNSLVSSEDLAADAYVQRIQRILEAANTLAPEQLPRAASSLVAELQGARVELAETCTSVPQWLAVARATAPDVGDFRLPAEFERVDVAAAVLIDFDDLMFRAQIAEYYDRNTGA